MCLQIRGSAGILGSLLPADANVAQSVEQRFRKERVVSSILTVGSISYRLGDNELRKQGARVSVDSSVAELPHEDSR